MDTIMKRRMNARRSVAVGAVAVLAGLGLAAVPAASANAAWYPYGYANCSSPSHPTTMSTSVGYTYHEINDGAGWSYEDDAGSGASKFHSLGIANTSAHAAGIEVYSETYTSWGCAGSGYAYTGW
jgi:hypothetical protein